MDIAAQAHLDNFLWAVATVIFIIVSSFLTGKLAAFIARLTKQSPGEQRRIFWGFALAGPWIVGFFIFVLGPSLASLYYSFTNYKLTDAAPVWTGLDNYRQFLLGLGAQGQRFETAMYNSFYYAVVGVPLQILAALGMALMLNQKIRGVRLFRLIFYLPVILAGGPAILISWRYMLNPNGGFINLTLQSIAHSFFLFDWVYRGFIFVVEGFNGFYASVAKGDTIGPLMYAIPTIIGLLALYGLRGEWSDIQRERAKRVIEVVGLLLVGAIMSTGLMAQQIDFSWTLAVGVVATVGVILNARTGKTRLMRAWQIGALALIGAGLVLSIVQAEPNSDFTTGYIFACLIAALPLLVTAFGKWNRSKYYILGGLIVVLCLIMFIHSIPGQLDGGQMLTLPRLLTLNTTIADPSSLDYLNKNYMAQALSPLWFYGVVVVWLGALVVLNNRNPKLQRYLVIGGIVFFGLLSLGSLLDGVRYFRAYETIAANTAQPNYHFGLFYSATKAFPNENRVPLWYSNPLWAKPSLILITLWSSGGGMLIFLAALQGVPRVFYESAEVDGASRWQRFFKITLPLITPALFYNIVIGVIAALQTFETIYIIQSPAQNPNDLTSAAYFLFIRTFRELDIGQGAAASWILVVVIVVLTTFQFRYSRWVNYEA